MRGRADHHELAPLQVSFEPFDRSEVFTRCRAEIALELL